MTDTETEIRKWNEPHGKGCLCLTCAPNQTAGRKKRLMFRLPLVCKCKGCNFGWLSEERIKGSELCVYYSRVNEDEAREVIKGLVNEGEANLNKLRRIVLPRRQDHE